MGARPERRDLEGDLAITQPLPSGPTSRNPVGARDAVEVALHDNHALAGLDQAVQHGDEARAWVYL